MDLSLLPHCNFETISLDATVMTNKCLAWLLNGACFSFPLQFRWSPWAQMGFVWGRLSRWRNPLPASCCWFRTHSFSLRWKESFLHMHSGHQKFSERTTTVLLAIWYAIVGCSNDAGTKKNSGRGAKECNCFELLVYPRPKQCKWKAYWQWTTNWEFTAESNGFFLDVTQVPLPCEEVICCTSS